MKRFAIAALFLSFCTVAAFAQTNPMPLDGRWWTILSRQERLVYIQGLEDGVVIFATNFAGLPDPKVAAVKPITDGVIQRMSSKATMGELVDQIEAFYADKANAQILAMYAWQYCVRRTNGDSSKDLNDMLTVMRRLSSQ